MDNREYEILANEIRGSAAVNMHDRAYISEEDVTIPISDEYVHFNNLDEYGFDDEEGIDAIDENLQQDDFIHNDEIHFEHDGDGVNAPIEVLIVLEGFATVNSR